MIFVHAVFAALAARPFERAKILLRHPLLAHSNRKIRNLNIELDHLHKLPEVINPVFVILSIF